MLAEPEMIDSRNDGYMTQTSKLLGSPLDQLPALAREQLLGLARVFSPRDNPRGTKGSSAPGTQSKAAKPTNLAVYETNIGSMTGSAAITQADIDHAIPSMGAGLAVADHMLLMLRDLGITTQCLFALPEYLNNFGAPGPKRMVPLWGSVIDMGGATNRRRPQFLAEQLVNQAILPTELATHLTGPPHTWSQPESPNGKIHLENAHLLQTFAFADGASHSIILLNLSRTEAIPVTFAGSIKPSGQLEESQLTSAHITDSNELSEQVTPHQQHLAHFNPSVPYPLPPFSITVLTWRY
jgi:hypothetical protein